MKKGWINFDRFQSKRHSLASLGIKTGRKTYSKVGKGIITLKDNGMFYPKKKPYFIKEPFGLPRELTEKGKFRAESIYEAPVDKIREGFKKIYGKYPTDTELNDLLLEGSEAWKPFVLDYSVGDMMKMNREGGFYFFSPDTMAFFKSRIESDELIRDKYFITSEQTPHNPRKFTIRAFDKATGDVNTVGEFGEFATRGEALKIAKSLNYSFFKKHKKSAFEKAMEGTFEGVNGDTKKRKKGKLGYPAGEHGDWIKTDAWRGYYKPKNAVLGSSDTGSSSDSPAPSQKVDTELKRFQSELMKAGIDSKISWTRSSNAFMVKRWVEVRPQDKAKAKSLAKTFLRGTEFSHLPYPKEKPTERTFKIVIPKFDNSGNPIRAIERKSIAKKMAERFGGVSVQKLSGFYIGKDNKLQGEENIMLMSSRDLRNLPKSILNKDRKFIKELAQQSRKKFGQESIMTEEDIIQDVSFTTGRKRPALPKQMIGEYEEIEP